MADTDQVFEKMMQNIRNVSIAESTVSSEIIRNVPITHIPFIKNTITIPVNVLSNPHTLLTGNNVQKLPGNRFGYSPRKLLVQPITAIKKGINIPRPIKQSIEAALVNLVDDDIQEISDTADPIADIPESRNLIMKRRGKSLKSKKSKRVYQREDWNKLVR